LSVCLNDCLFVFMSVCLRVCVSVCLSYVVMLSYCLTVCCLLFVVGLTSPLHRNPVPALRTKETAAWTSSQVFKEVELLRTLFYTGTIPAHKTVAAVWYCHCCRCYCFRRYNVPLSLQDWKLLKV
jgi:hypothetical protein